MPKIINRVGEEYTTNEGYKIKIVEYFSALSCTIQFEDGAIRENIYFSCIKNGSVRYIIDYVGKTYSTNQGYIITIIEYISFGNVTIKFNDTNETILKNIRLGDIKNGEVANPYHPNVCGVGYYGDDSQSVRKNKKLSKVKRTWRGMLNRCYNKKEQEKHPAYKDVTVCKEWHNFQNFAQWFEENWKPYMQDWQLDKDILVKGNKIYSPETCCFVPAEINSLFTKNKPNEFYNGVKKAGKYRFLAQICIKNKKTHLGTFDTSEEAFKVYKVTKENYFKELANNWKKLISEKVYQALINYKVENNGK
mgnify:CR=1 FL=1